MNATIEISLYALTENYVQIVLDFIAKIKENKELEFVTNGLSTQIFGDYATIMNILTEDMKFVLEQVPSVFVLKIGKGILKY
ncbi:MAG: hypothetical protein EAZ27_08865 [Cytophagales bacterium]|nr:MAG: hypothetical protein EAZ27_08865 [Cytophagales bacterium]